MVRASFSFVLVLLGVLGVAGFDLGGEGHPEGADGGEFSGSEAS